MGDQNNAGEGEKDTKTENGADNQDESQKDGGADGEATGADTSDDENADKKDGDEAGDEDSKEGADKKDASKENKDTKKPTPQADEEPKTRKRNIDFILQRKDRQIKDLKDKKDENADQKDGEGEEDIADEDAKIIDKRVQAHLKPLIEKQMQDEDKQEIADFVKENPHFAPYVAKVAKFSQHESRRNMPIASIFYEVAGPDLLKIGADLAKKAGDEARKSNAGGGQSRGGESEKSIWDLTPEEFAARQEETRNKNRE